MACQNVFRRYELKYLLDEQQHTAVMKAVHAHMIPNRYAHSAIRSLYFDTDNYRLARHSIEKPVYKEKMSLRGYGNILPDSPVFVELKKKYKKIVYKRRLSMSEREATAWLGSVYHRIDRRLPVRSNMCCITMNHYIRSSS